MTILEPRLLRKLSILFISVIMLISFFTSISCSNIDTGIFFQIVKEQVILNTDALDDFSSPTIMCEDNDYFYVVLNKPYRGSKTLGFPKGYKNEEGLENEIVTDWTSLSKFNLSVPGLDTTKLGCRAMINFNGTIYGSFSDETFFYRNFNGKDSSYNFILKLEGDTWVDSAIPLPNIDAPIFSKPNKTSTITAADIKPQTDRVFPWHDNYDYYTNQNINSLTANQSNAYRMALLFDANQWRESEAVKFYAINGTELYILFNDTYVNEYDDSSSIKYGKNPVYRLFRVNDVATTPSLTEIELKEQNSSTHLVTEKTVLENIKAKMQADSSLPYGVARYKSVLELLFTKRDSAESKKLAENFSEKINGGTAISYSKTKHLKLQNSIPFKFKRYIQDSSGKDYFFSTLALYELDRTLTPPLLTNVTNDKLMNSYVESIYKKENGSDILVQKVLYNQYRYIDLYSYKDSSGQQYLCLSAAYNRKGIFKDLTLGPEGNIDSKADTDSDRYKYLMFTFKGNLNDVSKDKWIEQRLEVTNRSFSTSQTSISSSLINSNNSSNYAPIPTSFIHYYSGKSGRNIDKLLVASTNGFFDGVSNPESTLSYETPTNEALAKDASTGKFIDQSLSFEENILSISISSSYIQRFFAGTAYRLDANGVKQNVPVLFALTAGNGLWINYNRYWNRE